MGRRDCASDKNPGGREGKEPGFPESKLRQDKWIGDTQMFYRILPPSWPAGSTTWCHAENWSYCVASQS